MSVTAFRHPPAVPDMVARLDPDIVVETLSRHAINVSEAASELGVGSADLRRLLWAKPHLVDAAAEMEERRLDIAEKNIFEALQSDDPRRRDAASMFTIRNSAKARRRGWITSSSGVDVSVNAPGQVVFQWRDTPGPDPQADAEAARLRDEGKQVISIGWGNPDDDNPDDGKTIEHDPNPAPSAKG